MCIRDRSATGTYQVSDRVREKLQKRFAGYFCDDAETKAVIGRIYQKYDYLIDPHTAVAFDALEQYRSETGDQTPCIVVSTASPFKFCDNVLGALGVTEVAQGLDALDQLSAKTGLPTPAPLSSLRNKEIRFTRTVEKENMVLHSSFSRSMRSSVHRQRKCSRSLWKKKVWNFLAGELFR